MMLDDGVLKMLLTEYGAAFRGDWSYIDGRGVKIDMETFVEIIDSEDVNVRQMRDRLDLCPDGRGHWTDWCQEIHP